MLWAASIYIDCLKWDVILTFIPYINLSFYYHILMYILIKVYFVSLPIVQCIKSAFKTKWAWSMDVTIERPDM